MICADGLDAQGKTWLLVTVEMDPTYFRDTTLTVRHFRSF